MPHTLSAKKRLRQNLRRRVRNRAIKSRIRTAERRFREALAAADLEAARAAFRRAQKLLLRAANNGPIHRNFAARHISRLQQRLNEAEKKAGA